jgi:hypothetical protein
MTLSMNDTQHNSSTIILNYAECRVLFFDILNVFMLSAVMLSVVAPLKCTETKLHYKTFSEPKANLYTAKTQCKNSPRKRNAKTHFKIERVNDPKL